MGRSGGRSNEATRDSSDSWHNIVISLIPHTAYAHGSGSINML